MIPLNYHHLYYFWVTAKKGGMTQAKEELLLSQPTLSLQIKQLEKALGKTLLHRGRDGVSLTADGRIAFEFCERIFTQGQALVAALRHGPAGLPPVLRLGAGESISREIVLRLLGRIAELAPKARSTILSAPAGVLRESLARRAIDLAVSESDFSPALGRNFRGRLAGEIPILLVCSPRLKAALKGARELPMLLRTPENPLRKEVESHLLRRGLRAAVAAETDDPDLIRILALKGKGVAALNALAIRKDLADKRLVPLDKTPSGIKEYVWLIAAVPPGPEAGLQTLLDGLMTDFKVL